MKETFPSYTKGATRELEAKLKPLDKAVLDSFMIYVSANAGKLKQSNRKKDLLQIHDVIEKKFGTWDYDDVVSFVALLKEDSRAAWTKKGMLTTLSIFLKWKHDDWSSKFKNFDVVKKLQRQLQPRNDDRYNEETMITAEELDVLIRTADKLMYKLWISMCGEAGIPYAVQSNLKWSDVKIDDMEDGITTLTYIREKNGHKFVFPLGKTTTYYLKQWKQEYPFPKLTKNDLIFPSPTNREKSITQPSIYSMLNRVSKKSGLNKHLYQYLIRHSVLSESYGRNGMTEEVHRKLYGHKPGSRMTKTYSHQGEEETLRKALELLHKVKPISKEEKNELKELKSRLKKIEAFINQMIPEENGEVYMNKDGKDIIIKKPTFS